MPLRGVTSSRGVQRWHRRSLLHKSLAWRRGRTLMVDEALKRGEARRPASAERPRNSLDVSVATFLYRAQMRVRQGGPAARSMLMQGTGAVQELPSMVAGLSGSLEK